MIKESQEKYLDSLQDGKIVEIMPFDPRARKIGNEVVSMLNSALPDLLVQFGGAAAFEIVGQNDVDILLLSTPAEHERYRRVIEELFGPPSRIGVSGSVKWEFKREGFDVEIYMADKGSSAAREQIRTFELLSQSKELRDAYEQVKLPLGPIDFKEYMRKKYEFFNTILS